MLVSLIVARLINILVIIPHNTRFDIASFYLREHNVPVRTYLDSFMVVYLCIISSLYWTEVSFLPPHPHTCTQETKTCHVEA